MTMETGNATCSPRPPLPSRPSCSCGPRTSVDLEAQVQHQAQLRDRDIEARLQEQGRGRPGTGGAGAHREDVCRPRGPGDRPGAEGPGQSQDLEASLQQKGQGPSRTSNAQPPAEGPGRPRPGGLGLQQMDQLEPRSLAALFQELAQAAKDFEARLQEREQAVQALRGPVPGPDRGRPGAGGSSRNRRPPPPSVPWLERNRELEQADRDRRTQDLAGEPGGSRSPVRNGLDDKAQVSPGPDRIQEQLNARPRWPKLGMAADRTTATPRLSSPGATCHPGGDPPAPAGRNQVQQLAEQDEAA